MKWFKHFSDSRKNPKLRAVERRFGEAGYARFFRLLEVVAERGGSGESFAPRVDLKSPHTDLLWLSEEIGVPMREAKRTLDFFASVNLIDPAAWQEQVVLIPQMLSYRDEFTTRRQRALSEHNPDSVPIQSRPTPAQKESTDVEVEVKGEEGKRTAACVAHPAFAPARDFAFQAFKQKLNQKPAWSKKDFVLLADLFKRRPDLSLEEFSRRWRFYLDSTEAFICGQGRSLGFFCAKFDSFIAGPIHERGAASTRKSAAAQARDEERRRNEISPEGKAILKRFGGEN